ncbi:glycerophosphodiester phosphodiesterase [Corynebacterium sp. A21]|uniref:glycerophosphodiester phosphodiesterase n=1 Tax=Corynebacterium sp. A21 TaxID=3457318 RepID=UPI003FD4E820
MKIVGHRGAEDLELENTLASFVAAEAAGADAIELDVHASRDNQVVVIHDPTAARVGNPDSGRLEEPMAALRLSEIKEIELRDGSSIPTLEEVLDAVKLPIQVEVKAAGAVPALATLFERRPDDLKRVLFISFFDIILTELAARLPSSRLGVLRAPESIFDLAILEELNAVNIAAFLPSVASLEISTIAKLQARGIKVGCWTIKDEATLKVAERAGVDMVTVSNPRKFRAEPPIAVQRPSPESFW